MCTHIAIPSRDDLKKKLGPQYDIGDYNAAWHAAGYAHPVVPAVASGHRHNVLGYSWGLVPAWVKNTAAAAEIATKTLNARGETMWELPSFRDAALGGRCLLFLNGFFEWRHEGREKQPWFIYNDHTPFAVGGLCSAWVNPDTGEVLHTTTIVTTPANDLMAYIHNEKQRMPLILPEAQWDLWLDAASPAAEVSKLVVPLPDGILKAHRVSKLITSRTQKTNVPEVQHEFRDTLF